MNTPINDGGPAFPCENPDSPLPFSSGMSIRAYIATAVFPTVIASLGPRDCADRSAEDVRAKVAVVAVAYADALIAELNKPPA